MPPRRLRSGAFPDPTGMTRPVTRQPRTYSLPVTKVPTQRPTRPSPTSPTRPRRQQRPRTGAQRIRRAGGGQRAVNTWRSLSQQRRNRIKRQVRRGGGSLLQRVRKIQRRRRSR